MHFGEMYFITYC